jgi:FMN phosphatase YigB (HAD superfamily)
MDKTVFLFDVDNTLLDHDKVTKDMHEFLEKEVGSKRSGLYWDIFEKIRAELGYADYLGALQEYRLAYPYDSHLLAVSNYLINYPFAERVYPESFEVIKECQELGKVVILTDGDVVFQPRKIETSGLFEAVDGNILIYIHKEKELPDIERRYPAERYVVVDDKIRLLSAIKEIWGDRVTTVFVRQGHYALDKKEVSKYPPADATIDRIGELLSMKI